MSPSGVANTAQNARLPFRASTSWRAGVLGLVFPSILSLIPRTYLDSLTAPDPLALSLGQRNPLLAVLGRPRGCRAWPSAHPGASGWWEGGCSDNGGATCEGESVLVYFLLEVFDLKVPLLQQLVQSPVLIRCFPELMAKLFDLIFQHPARQRHPGLLFLPGDPRAGIGASLPRAVVPHWALGGDQNWSVQNRKAKLETSQ